MTTRTGLLQCAAQENVAENLYTGVIALVACPASRKIF